MPTIEINDLDKLGAVRDEPSYQIAPEAFTTALNMRVIDGGLQRMSGNEQVFGTPGVAPHFAVALSSVAQNFWVYTSLLKGYVYDGASHTNITRQTAAVDVDYSAAETRDWNGTILAGIPILNNGHDVPQFWGTPTVATKLANLTNWPATLRARKVVAFGAYLVAIYITDSGAIYPHLVRWSNETSSPGTLPNSWDITDPTVDAGAYDLPDVQSGVLVEALPLGGKLMLYKEQSTWVMRRVGGRVVFAFDTLFDTLGILAPRCVSITGDGFNHVVMTQDDIIIHNGSSKPQSIIDRRLRRSIFNDLDPTNYLNSFTFTDSEFKEVWCCYPQQGQVYANKAVVFNYKTGAVTEADVAFRNAASGVIDSANVDLWSDGGGADTWEVDTGPWSSAERRRIVLCDPANSKFLQQNTGLIRNGSTYDAILQRIGLSVVGKKRTGEWIVDHEVMKFVSRLWPKIQGGPVRVRVGFQQLVNGPVTWKDYKDFDPSLKMTADFVGCGRATAIEFSTAAPVDWRIDGYKIDVQKAGNF